MSYDREMSYHEESFGFVRIFRAVHGAPGMYAGNDEKIYRTGD